MLRRWRLKTRCSQDRKVRAAAYAESRADIVWWCNNFVITYDPRLAETGEWPYIPFDLWERQEEYLRWLEARVASGEEFLVEKSRDVGLSWLNVAFAAHRWLFRPGFNTIFGANKEDSVDRLGDPKSLFEKIRCLIYRLPDWQMPEGFSSARHDNHMRLINPVSGNTITGESGDNMGRGGRATLYIVDEAAHVERADRAEAAIIAVANARGWVSSVYGAGGLFARKRNRLPSERVFTFHFRDDPRKDAAWEARMRADTDPVIFAQEYDIDYAASVEDLCIPAAWVQSAQRLGSVADVRRSNLGMAGLDVGGGKAKSVFIPRFGPVVGQPKTRQRPDTTETAHWALDRCGEHGIADLRFDTVGIGEGVASTLRHNKRQGLRVEPVNTGDAPSNTVWPDGRTSAEMFQNLKGEVWWLMRNAFKRTHERYLWEMGEDGGVEHRLDECLSLPEPRDKDAQQLAHELSLPRWMKNEKGKIRLERKDELARRGISSPDYADALALTFKPEGQRNRMVKVVGI